MPAKIVKDEEGEIRGSDAGGRGSPIQKSPTQDDEVAYPQRRPGRGARSMRMERHGTRGNLPIPQDELKKITRNANPRFS